MTSTDETAEVSCGWNTPCWNVTRTSGRAPIISAPATAVATAADHHAQVRSVCRHPFQSLRATDSEKNGVAANENAPPSNASATLTHRPAYARAETLPAGSI